MQTRFQPAVFGALLALLVLSVWSGQSLAAITNPTPQRAYVSAANGNDANNCGQASPCRTIQAALGQVVAGGEVLVLDNGGYGGNINSALMYITQSVTITVPSGLYAGISPPVNYDGIIINAPGATVTLRGLSINSQIQSCPASVVCTTDVGIRITAANAVNIENCVINGMIDTGIAVENGPMQLSILNSNLHNNHFGVTVNNGMNTSSVIPVTIRNSNFIVDANMPNGATGDYVQIYSQQGSQLLLDSSSVTGGNFGVLALGGVPGSSATIINSNFNGVVGYGVWLANAPLRADIRGNSITGTSVSSGSSGIGIQYLDPGVVSTLQGNTITGNVIGISMNQGGTAPVVQTLGSNNIHGNTSVDIQNGTLTTLTPQ